MDSLAGADDPKVILMTEYMRSSFLTVIAVLLASGCEKSAILTDGGRTATPATSSAVVSEAVARESFTKFVSSKIGQSTPPGKTFPIRKLIVDVDQIEVRATGMPESPFRASARVFSRSANIPEQKVGHVTLLFRYAGGDWVYTDSRDSSSELKYRQQEIDFFKS